MKKLVFPVLVILLLALSLFLVFGNETKKADEVGDFEYNIVTVEGMPCMVVSSYTYYEHYVISVTCDWSKWEGN